MTTVIMTDEDAERFKVFLEHYTMFSALIDNGVNSMRSGTMQLTFDEFGVMRGIKKEHVVYRI